jgi:Skp family chaperone for outer membrane proteins
MILKPMKMKTISIVTALIFSTCIVSAQTRVELASVNGVQVYMAQMRPVLVVSKKRFNSFQEEVEFLKLKRAVFAVYPYAKIAGALYAQVNEDAGKLNKRRNKNQYLRLREEELRTQFEDKLKDLTFNQGKVLIKLINRETGNNCYGLIKELKNPVAAAMWNIWAKKYGYDLKEPYVASENADLEFIVKALEELEDPAVYSAQFY